MKDLLAPPTTDLRDQLNKKTGAHQITLYCCCEWLITIALLE